jgi:hypothetical protein
VIDHNDHKAIDRRQVVLQVVHLHLHALHVPVIALHVLLKVEAMSVAQVEVVAMIAQELHEMSPMAVLSVIHEVFVQLRWSVTHHEYVLESSSQIFQNMLPVKS